VLAQTAPSSEWKPLTEVYPEDVNRQQVFDLTKREGTDLADGITAMKLVFEESSDFFGRITVYDFTLEGRIVNGQP
jgi:hypothetical protein